MTFSMACINIALMVAGQWPILPGESRSFQNLVKNKSQLVTCIRASRL